MERELTRRGDDIKMTEEIIEKEKEIEKGKQTIVENDKYFGLVLQNIHEALERGSKKMDKLFDITSNTNNNVSKYQGQFTEQVINIRKDITQIEIKQKELSEIVSSNSGKIQPLESQFRNAKKILIWFFGPLNIAGVIGFFWWLIGKK